MLLKAMNFRTGSGISKTEKNLTDQRGGKCFKLHLAATRILNKSASKRSVSILLRKQNVQGSDSYPLCYS